MIWVAVDAMGGDYAPRHVVDGAFAAARHFELGVALVGSRALLETELLRHTAVDRDRIRFVEAAVVVGMDESPAAALRRKPRASISVAAELVARGDAAALFSAGHTGATVMAAHGAFGMLSGVGRPALAATLPTRVGRPAVLLDVGASVDSSEYGGAPLLGVAGVTIARHGRSSAKAVRNAVAMAYRFAADRFIDRVQKGISASSLSSAVDR